LKRNESPGNENRKRVENQQASTVYEIKSNDGKYIRALHRA